MTKKTGVSKDKKVKTAPTVTQDPSTSVIKRGKKTKKTKRAK
jgi:hypothetical protein